MEASPEAGGGLAVSTGRLIMWWKNPAVWLFWGAMILNAFMDAIDHGKGKRKLRYVWHLVKWWLFVPALFFSGFFLARDPLELPELVLSVMLGLWLWEGAYRAFRQMFKKTGIPWWF